MTGRDRVQALISGQAVDRVPIGDFHHTDDLVAALLGLPPGAAVTLSDRKRCLDQLGCDVVGGYPCLPDGSPLLGVARARGMGVGGSGAQKRFSLPAPGHLDWGDVRFWARESDQFVWGIVPGVFGELSYMVGCEDFLVMTVTEPEVVAAMAAEMVTYSLEYAASCVEAGAEGILIGDDVAFDGGLLLAPARWRELFLPHLARLVAALRRLGVPVFYHADGNINAILPDLVATGINGLHSLKPSAGMDLAAVKADWGHRLCLWGNLDLGFPLTLGSTDELIRTVHNTIAIGWQGGGFIFGTCSGCLDGEVSPERVAVMYKAAAHAARCLVT